jgi:hypothetical protein
MPSASSMLISVYENVYWRLLQKYFGIFHSCKSDKIRETLH